MAGVCAERTNSEGGKAESFSMLKKETKLRLNFLCHWASNQYLRGTRKYGGPWTGSKMGVHGDSTKWGSMDMVQNGGPWTSYKMGVNEPSSKWGSIDLVQNGAPWRQYKVGIHGPGPKWRSMDLVQNGGQ